MEYYNVANYMGRLKFMWLGKSNNNSLKNVGVGEFLLSNGVGTL